MCFEDIFFLNRVCKSQRMAFDRTERFVKRATSTSARIGPGIYDVSVLSKPTRDPGNL